MHNILQWNINGLQNNLTDLQLLIHQYKPIIIVLQETHLKTDDSFIVSTQYDHYYYNLPINSMTKKQGIAILIRKGIPHKSILVQSSIAALALEVKLGFKYSIINVYIPPNQKFMSSDLLGIINQVPGPIILLGDFNAWSPLWGSNQTNARGRLIEDVILFKNLIVLNDGSPTHLSTHNTLTNVDICFGSASISTKLTCSTLSNLGGSDHFPLITAINTGTMNDFVFKPKFIFEKADWDRFSSIVTRNMNKFPPSDNINKEAVELQKILRSAAHLSIKQTTPRRSPKCVPWWSIELEEKRNKKQQAGHFFKHHRSRENLIKYKKLNAVFRKACRAAKNASLVQLTESINASTNQKKNLV